MWHMAYHDNILSHLFSRKDLKSKKQKHNTRRSTGAELFSTDDDAGPMLWTSRFVLQLGYDVKTIRIKITGVPYLWSQMVAQVLESVPDIWTWDFFINDLKVKGLVSIKYCPTEEMVADYMTKPLHCSKFTIFRNMIMNLTNQQYFL